MYKLTLGSINQIKSTTGYSGTIETDRVVIVDSDGKYLQTDGNWGTELKVGLVRTWSAARDTAEIDLLKTKYTAKSADKAAVYIWADVMVLQSDFASVSAFVEYLVDEKHAVVIQGYANPKYKLGSVSVTAAGSGYTDETIDVTIPGDTGDTAGVVTVTITNGKCASAVIKSAGSYEIKKTKTVSVTATAGSGGKIKVTMTDAD